MMATEGEKRTTQIARNLADETQQANNQFNSDFARSQQEFADQIASQFDASVNRDLDLFAAQTTEKAVVGNAEAGFITPSLRGISDQTANVSFQVAALNEVQSVTPQERTLRGSAADQASAALARGDYGTAITLSNEYAEATDPLGYFGSKIPPKHVITANDANRFAMFAGGPIAGGPLATARVLGASEYQQLVAQDIGIAAFGIAGGLAGGVQSTTAFKPSEQPLVRNSVFLDYPSTTTLSFDSQADQIGFLIRYVPGLTEGQANTMATASFAKNSSFVLGGSRVFGDYRISSDLDIGFGNMTVNYASKVISRANAAGPLKIEATRIVPGNETLNIPRISTPEEFFQRSGVRSLTDLERPGAPFSPSGSITVSPDGSITITPPRATP